LYIVSNEKDRIDRIFFDSREDKFIVTNKREGVCKQRANYGNGDISSSI
jgi:hypothetical protein